MSSSEVLSIAELLRLHPWPNDLKDQKHLEWLWHFDLPGDLTWLWALIADTSRLNRALGFAEMHFEDRGDQRWGTAKNGGVAHEWHEVPWNWVQGEWLTCTRLYTSGFAKAMYAIHRLVPIDGGNRLYLYFGAIPRGVAGGLALRVGFPTLQKAYARLLPAMAQDRTRRRPAILEIPPPQLTSEATQRLASGRDALVAAGLQPLCVKKLLDWVATGDEQDLYRIQIRERARVWQLNEHDLLRVALHATRLGILNLSWDTVCPHCRGVKEERAALADIVNGDRCNTCDVAIDLLEPNAVEVTFHVHSTIREIAERTFCSAEPATKEHIAVQVAVPSGGEITLQPRLSNGRYRVRTIGLAHSWYFDANDALDPTELSGPHPEGEVVSAHGHSTFVIRNASDATQQCVIERAAWKDHALGPGALLSFADFRDVFSTDFVQADVRIAVGEQTILFTDVVGSTAFYETHGDPTAFVEIKKHFDEVFALLASHNGACIKTIGDAVMAAFVNPVDALKCSAAIHAQFGPTRTTCPLRLRISLNTGPCIAVKFSSGMDYFGGTVNIAAKLQSLAETWQVAMSGSTHRAPGVADYLASINAKQVPLQYSSKAMNRPIGVIRWDVFDAH